MHSEKIKIKYTNIIRVRNVANRLKNEPSKTQLFDLGMFFYKYTIHKYYFCKN